MTVSVTKASAAIVSGPADGVHISKAAGAVVSGPEAGVHIIKISMAVVIDSTPSGGRRRQMIVC